MSYVSFTGTRKGMTPEQRNMFFVSLIEFDADLLIHGDCVGADSDAHDIAADLGIPTRLRPCDLEDLRAYRSSGDIRDPKPPLERNREIVDDGDVLVATPDSFEERQRSGTWSTVRYAKGRGKKVFIIWPDGTATTL